jgi:hypothetical protein
MSVDSVSEQSPEAPYDNAKSRAKQWCNHKSLNHLTCDAKTNIVNPNDCRITTKKIVVG